MKHRGTKQLIVYRRCLIPETATHTGNHVREKVKTTMISLIFMWLLPLTASNGVTPALLTNFTDVTEDQFSHKQLTTKTSTLEQISESLDVKTSTTEVVSSTQGSSSSNPSTQTTQTPPATITENNQAAATSVSYSQNNFTSSTGKTNNQKPVTMILTSQTSNKFSPSTEPSAQSHFTQSEGPGKPSASEMTSLSTPTSQSITFISTATSIKRDTSSSSHPVTLTSGSYKTTAGTTSTYVEETNMKINSKKTRTQTNHSKVVAGVIGGALCLMMVGFLVIYIKKHRLQKRQITTDWAGPSPFLESDTDNGKVPLRSSNRISLSSFLPQRLSKRLSLLPERDEELQDMTPGATFGGKLQEITSGQGVDGKDAQKHTGSAVVVSEIKSKEEGTETCANCVSESASENTINRTPNHSEAAKIEQDQSDNQSDLLEKSATEDKDDLGSPKTAVPTDQPKTPAVPTDP